MENRLRIYCDEPTPADPAGAIDLAAACETLAAMLRDRAWSSYARGVLLRPEERAALEHADRLCRRARGLPDDDGAP